MKKVISASVTIYVSKALTLYYNDVAVKLYFFFKGFILALPCTFYLES